MTEQPERQLRHRLTARVSDHTVPLAINILIISFTSPTFADSRASVDIYDILRRLTSLLIQLSNLLSDILIISVSALIKHAKTFKTPAHGLRPSRSPLSLTDCGGSQGVLHTLTDSYRLFYGR